MGWKWETSSIVLLEKFKETSPAIDRIRTNVENLTFLVWENLCSENKRKLFQMMRMKIHNFSLLHNNCKMLSEFVLLVACRKVKASGWDAAGKEKLELGVRWAFEKVKVSLKILKVRACVGLIKLKYRVNKSISGTISAAKYASKVFPVQVLSLVERSTYFGISFWSLMGNILMWRLLRKSGNCSCEASLRIILDLFRFGKPLWARKLSREICLKFIKRKLCVYSLGFVKLEKLSSLNKTQKSFHLHVLLLYNFQIHFHHEIRCFYELNHRRH